MGITFNIIFFIVGLLLIIKGGDYFVDASISIAKKWKIPAVIIGATIVSLATALPELIVSTIASAQGEFDLAIGNAVGSMISNTTLICGLSIAFVPALIKKGSSFKYYFLIVGVIFLAFCGINYSLDLFETIILFLLFFGFFIFSILDAFKEKKVQFSPEHVSEESSNVVMSIPLMIFLFILGAGCIAFGAMTLVSTATALSALIGISDEFIGLTVVALGTSLPELTTTIISIRKKESALGYGNIIGANIINLTLLLGVSGIFAGTQGIPFSNESVFFTIPLLLVSTLVFLLPLIFKSRTYRWQGLLLIGLYAIYMAVLIISVINGGIFA